MNNITRKNFLKTISLTFASLFSSSALANSSSVDFGEHNGNPVDFIENYFVIESYDEHENAKHIKLRDYQKEYVNKLNSSKFFVCNKCRQSGITTMNVAFACWKAAMHEDINIVLVEPSEDAVDSVKKLLELNHSITDNFKNGSRILVVTDVEFNSTAFNSSKHNLIILDELAFFGKEFKERKIYTSLGGAELIAISSTPCMKADIFDLYCDLAERSTHCYMKISGDMVFSKNYLNFVKSIRSDDMFNCEFMNKFTVGSLF